MATSTRGGMSGPRKPSKYSLDAHPAQPPPKSKRAQLTDPGLSMPPAVTPAPHQRDVIAQATTRARKAAGAYGHGGVTGLIGEYTGPSIAHLLATGHVD